MKYVPLFFMFLLSFFVSAGSFILGMYNFMYTQVDPGKNLVLFAIGVFSGYLALWLSAIFADGFEKEKKK